MSMDTWTPSFKTNLVAEVKQARPTKAQFASCGRGCSEIPVSWAVTMEEAERRGDSREAREFREHLERVESMIDQSGGDPDASEAEPGS